MSMTKQLGADGWDVSINDAAGSDPATKIYSDGTYTYVCASKPGAVLTDPVWRVSRVDADGSTKWADGNKNFDNVATDVGTVAALSFS